MFTLKDLNLEKFASDKRYQDYLASLNTFVKQISKNRGITHIFVHGSFILGKLRKGSDLDFDVISTDVTQTLQKKSM